MTDAREVAVPAAPRIRAGTVMTPRSQRFIDAMAANVELLGPRAAASRVRALVRQHEEWRRGCLNLLPSENSISGRARALLSAAIATRLTEGFPGDKEFPPPRHNVEIDEIEATLIALARQLIPARHVEWRATSNTMANAMALQAVTAPGDTILAQAMHGGGNMSYHPGAVPDLLWLTVADLPPDQELGFDLDAARTVARERQPAAIIVGGSYILFPLPVEGLREIADEVGAALVYDAAHVGLLIASGLFQDPLREGADLLTMGTHKVMGGPIGGLVFTDRDDLAERILNRTYPLFVQTRDQNKYAAAAHALAELVAFGRAYAAQMVANAKALARALDGEGFSVLGKARGYTMTHQVVVDVREPGGPLVEQRCQAAGILLHKSRLPAAADPEERSGLRITVQEVTRQGMTADDMGTIARFIARAAAGEPSAPLAREVDEFARGRPAIHFSFDDEMD